MNIGLFIAGFALLLVAGGAIAWLRSREYAARKLRGRAQGWSPASLRAGDLARRLSTLALFQAGHSRRIESLMEGPQRSWIFSYGCQTGFEQRRVAHLWFVAAQEAGAEFSPAILTTQDWLLSIVRSPASREIVLQLPGQPSAWRLCTEDPREWSDELLSKLSRWLVGQSVQRTWELIPGHVVGYEPGRFEDDVFNVLPQKMREFTALLETHRPPAQQAAPARSSPAAGATAEPAR